MGPYRIWLAGTAAVALIVYLLLWLGYAQGWPLLPAMDTAPLEAAHRYGVGHPGWITGWDVFCTVFGPFAFRVVTVVIIVVLFVRRRPRPAVFLIIAVELSGLVTEIAKALVERPRPTTAFVSALSSSFPSGHALGVLVAVMALLVVAWPSLRPPLRPWLVAVSVLLVVAIGAGRVVLNVHHPSDVLAGWALGYVYVAVCVLLIPPRRYVTAAAGTPEDPGS